METLQPDASIANVCDGSGSVVAARDSLTADVAAVYRRDPLEAESAFRAKALGGPCPSTALQLHATARFVLPGRLCRSRIQRTRKCRQLSCSGPFRAPETASLRRSGQRSDAPGPSPGALPTHRIPQSSWWSATAVASGFSLS